MALPVFDSPLDAQADGYDAIPLTFGGIAYLSEAGKEILANGGAGVTVPAATTTVAGVVKKTSAITPLAAGADAATIVTKVNEIIAALKGAGISA